MNTQSMVEIITGNTEASEKFVKMSSKQGLRANIAQLTNLGFTEGEAKKLHAALNLETSLLKDANTNIPFVVRSPGDLFEYVSPLIKKNVEESLVVVALNTQNEVIGHKQFTQGNLDHVDVDTSAILHYPLSLNAARFVVAHNHTGSPLPSELDISFTKDLMKSCEFIGLELVDHLIIGDHHNLSLRDHLTIDFARHKNLFEK